MVCEHCGNPIPYGITACEFCGKEVSQETQQAPQQQQFQTQAAPIIRKRENVAAGVVGALFGAVIGAAVIILLSRLGFVASVSGLILAICTLKGYELLGGELSKKGIIICLILIIITPYMADRLDWAILIKESYAEYDLTLGDAFSVVPDFVKEGIIEKGTYLKSLLMIYAFAALGAFSTLKSLFE